MNAETHEPAWIDGVLWWVDRQSGKPVEPIGVERECDVPGLHTPGARARIHAMSAEKQHERAWPQTAL